MVIPNTYPSLSNIVHTDFELGRVMCTVAAADPGITGMNEGAFSHARVGCEDVRTNKDGVHFTSLSPAKVQKKILCAHKARIDQFFINE